MKTVPLRGAIRDALRFDPSESQNYVHAQASDRAFGRERRIRAGIVALPLGGLLSIAGFWLGRAIDALLDEWTDGGWKFFSRWLGDAGLLPYLVAGFGGIVALGGVYRLLTTLIPWLGGPGGFASTIRLLLIAVLGAVLVTALALIGAIEVV